MEIRNYTCQYCKKEYTPKRRRIQKFCSDSCRVGSHQLNKRMTNSGVPEVTKNHVLPKAKKEGINMAGVGNSFLGTIAATTTVNFLKNENDKPITKRDLIQVNLKLNTILEMLKKEEGVNGINFGFKPV